MAASKLPDGRTNQDKIKHGAFGFMRSGIHPCNKCVKKDVCDRFKKDADCSYLDDYQFTIQDYVHSLPHVQEEHRPLSQVLAKQLAVAALCELYFSEEGMVIHDKRKKKLSAQPLLEVYNKALSQAVSIMGTLGLRPDARIRLEHEKIKVQEKMDRIGVESEQVEEIDFLD